MGRERECFLGEYSFSIWIHLARFVPWHSKESRRWNFEDPRFDSLNVVGPSGNRRLHERKFSGISVSLDSSRLRISPISQEDEDDFEDAKDRRIGRVARSATDWAPVNTPRPRAESLEVKGQRRIVDLPARPDTTSAVWIGRGQGSSFDSDADHDSNRADWVLKSHKEKVSKRSFPELPQGRIATPLAGFFFSPISNASPDSTLSVHICLMKIRRSA